MTRFAFTLLAALGAAVPLLRADTALFREKFRAELADAVRFDGLAGVAIKDLATGDEFFVNPDTVFPQASSIKIHILAELYRQDRAGKLDVNAVVALPDSARTGGSSELQLLSAPSMTLRDYAILMIVRSDNTATNLLIDLLGMDAINASLVAWGLPEIKLQRRMIDLQAVAENRDNVATPRAMMRSLEKIYHGEVVDRATSNEVLKVLQLPRPASGLRAPLPSGVRIAHKTGSNAGVRCESGIVFLEQRPYVISVMTSFGASSAEAGALIEKVAHLAYGYFSRVDRSTPHGAGISR